MTYFNRDTLLTRRKWFKFSSAIILCLSIEIFLCSARPTENNTSVAEIGTTDTGVMKAIEELPVPSETQSQSNLGYEENETVGVDPTDDPDDINEILDCEDEFECTDPTDTPPNPNAPSKTFKQFKPIIGTSTMRPQSTTDGENPPDEIETSISQSNNNDEHPIDESSLILSTTPIQIQSTTDCDEVESETSTSSMLPIPTIMIERKAQSMGLTVTNSIFILLLSVLSTYFL